MTRVPFVFALIPLAALAATACVTETTVPGPDGEAAHLIRCPSADGCYEKAAEVCPEGYVMRSSGSEVSGYVMNGQAAVTARQSLVVSCKSDIPAAQPRAEGAVAAGGVVDQREDFQTCEAASRLAPTFGAYWVSKRHARALDEPPQPRDFVVVCRAMPENVQRCMHAKYRGVHAPACDAVLARLDPSQVAKIDSLFLAAPDDPKPASTEVGQSL